MLPVRPEISKDEIDTGTTWLCRGAFCRQCTGLSDGCLTVGGAPEELAPKAVIDWLNGRAKGYTT